jgi:hypothetical protein
LLSTFEQWIPRHFTDSKLQDPQDGGIISIRERDARRDLLKNRE